MDGNLNNQYQENGTYVDPNTNNQAQFNDTYYNNDYNNNSYNTDSEDNSGNKSKLIKIILIILLILGFGISLFYFLGKGKNPEAEYAALTTRICNAAEEYYNKHPEIIDTDTPGATAYVTLQKLSDVHLIESVIRDPRYKKGDKNEYIPLTTYVRLAVQSNGEVYCESVVDTGDDILAPILTLIGEPEVKLLLGTNFIDPGAKAVDDVDGDITSKITRSGNVDVMTKGDYTITYRVTDASGNSSSKDRIILVREYKDLEPTAAANLDVTPPQIEVKGKNPYCLKLGDKYIEPGIIAIDNVDGVITNKVIVDNKATGERTGTFRVTYTVSDTAGNKAVAYRSVEVKSSCEAIKPSTDPKPVNNKPTITLIGGTSVIWNLNEAYIDRGATAWDKEDGDLTKYIRVDASEVNVSVPGIYSVYYEVFDSKDAKATAKRLVTIANTNTNVNIPTAHFLETPGNLRFPVGNPQNIAVPEAEDSNGTKLTVTTVVKGPAGNTIPNVDFYKVGIYTIIYSATPSGGVTQTVSRNVEIFDNVAPTLTSPTTITLSKRDTNCSLTIDDLKKAGVNASDGANSKLPTIRIKNTVDVCTVNLKEPETSWKWYKKQYRCRWDKPCWTGYVTGGKAPDGTSCSSYCSNKHAGGKAGCGGTPSNYWWEGNCSCGYRIIERPTYNNGEWQNSCPSGYYSYETKEVYYPNDTTKDKGEYSKTAPKGYSIKDESASITTGSLNGTTIKIDAIDDYGNTSQEKSILVYVKETTPGEVTNVEIPNCGTNKQITLNVGGTVALGATVYPVEATNQTVTWSSNNLPVATVDSTGLVKAVAKGSTDIKAKTANGKETLCTVIVAEATVTTIPVTDVIIQGCESGSLDILKGRSRTLVADVKPNNATNKEVIWTSSDTTKATVDNGVLVGVEVGSSSIAVTTKDGNKTKTCNVTVKEPIIDNTAPSKVTVIYNAANTTDPYNTNGSWYGGVGKKQITLTVEATDAESGICDFEIVRANGKSSVSPSTSNPNRADIVFSNDTNEIIQIQAVNCGGMTGEISNPVLIRLDNTGPVVNFTQAIQDPNTWLSQSSYTTKYLGTDHGVGEVVRYEYAYSDIDVDKLDPKQLQVEAGVTIGEATFNEDLIKNNVYVRYIYFRAIDSLGNVGEWTKTPLYLNLDTVAPQAPGINITNNKSSKVTVGFTFVDNTSPKSSGFGKYIYKLNNGEDQVLGVQNGTFDITNVGQHKVEAWSFDKAGNKSATSTVKQGSDVEVVANITPPVATPTPTPPSGSGSGSTPDSEQKPTDNCSQGQIKDVVWKTPSLPPQNCGQSLPRGNYSYKVCVGGVWNEVESGNSNGVPTAGKPYQISNKYYENITWVVTLGSGGYEKAYTSPIYTRECIVPASNTTPTPPASLGTIKPDCSSWQTGFKCYTTPSGGTLSANGKSSNEPFVIDAKLGEYIVITASKSGYTSSSVTKCRSETGGCSNSRIGDKSCNYICTVSSREWIIGKLPITKTKYDDLTKTKPGSSPTNAQCKSGTPLKIGVADPKTNGVTDYYQWTYTPSCSSSWK